MKQSGRASILTIAAVVSVLLVLGMLFLGKESVTSVGDRFLQALYRGDVDTLTKMSYLGNDTEDQMRKKWDFAVNHAGKYYLFAYRITGGRQLSEDSAQVTLQYVKDAANPASYEEKYEIPLVKVGNEWKVDVKGMNRTMYPALPR
jgi:hypothetical protein